MSALSQEGLGPSGEDLSTEARLNKMEQTLLMLGRNASAAAAAPDAAPSTEPSPKGPGKRQAVAPGTQRVFKGLDHAAVLKRSLRAKSTQQ